MDSNQVGPLSLTKEQIDSLNKAYHASMMGIQHRQYSQDVSIQPEIAIKGNMVTATIRVPREDVEDFGTKENWIKEYLANMLAKGIIQNSLAEFTRQENIMDGSYTFRARLFATPDSTVRQLRKFKRGEL
jgi:hypothetical protein